MCFTRKSPKENHHFGVLVRIPKNRRPRGIYVHAREPWKVHCLGSFGSEKTYLFLEGTRFGSGFKGDIQGNRHFGGSKERLAHLPPPTSCQEANHPCKENHSGPHEEHKTVPVPLGKIHRNPFSPDGGLRMFKRQLAILYHVAMSLCSDVQGTWELQTRGTIQLS